MRSWSNLLGMRRQALHGGIGWVSIKKRASFSSVLAEDMIEYMKSTMGISGKEISEVVGQARSPLESN